MPQDATAMMDARRDLDRALDAKWLSGLWDVSNEDRTGEPTTKVKPHLWKWADVYDSLQRAREVIGISPGTSERRYIRLVNPGLNDRKLTAHTMLFGFQLIQPGEVAPAHRHHDRLPLCPPGQRGVHQCRRRVNGDAAGRPDPHAAVGLARA